MSQGTNPADAQALREQVERVAAARRVAAAARAELQLVRQAFDAAHVFQIEAAKAAQTACDAQETALRAMTVAVYQETGEKPTVPGLGIRETKEYEYDERDALTFAKQHGMALALDRKAFEKVVASGAFDLPFVKVKTVPSGTIATDLDKALGLADVVQASVAAEVAP